MKLLRSLLVAVGASGLVACASRAPIASSSAGANNVGVPATAANSTPATAAAVVTPTKDKLGVPYGYYRAVVDGQEKFCRHDPITGTRVESALICLTRDELENQRDSSRDLMENLSRLSGQGVGKGCGLPGC